MNTEKVTISLGVPTVWLLLLNHLRSSGEKLETVKESYFPKTKIEETASKDEVDSVAANAPIESNTDAMAAYTAALTKNIKSVKI